MTAREGRSKPDFPTLMERKLTASPKNVSGLQWSREYLRDEAILMISAGVDTTGTTIMVDLFNYPIVMVHAIITIEILTR